MKRVSLIIIKAEFILILLFVTTLLQGQADPGKKQPAGDGQKESQEIVLPEEKKADNVEASQVQDLEQTQNKKQETGKDVKEVKSSNPDMKKAKKGARPPYISRPSGSAKPQGAGKPAGAGKPGRR